MPVLKPAQSDRLLKQAIVLDFGDLQRQAHELMESVRAQAAAELAAARAKAEAIIAAADAKGHAQGIERGQAEGRAAGEAAARAEVLEALKPQLDHLCEQWATAVERWNHDRAAMLLEAREDVLRLAIAVAERLVHRIVNIERDVVLDVVAEALDLLCAPTRAEVLIRPDDRPLVESALQSIVERLRAGTEVTLRDDLNISPGGCVVKTVGGSIDARLETKLDRIVQALLPDGAAGRLARRMAEASRP